ncbi:unnamed protein product, partial [Staurois parvus]
HQGGLRAEPHRCRYSGRGTSGRIPGSDTSGKGLRASGTSGRTRADSGQRHIELDLGRWTHRADTGITRRKQQATGPPGGAAGTGATRRGGRRRAPRAGAKGIGHPRRGR